MRRLKRYRRQLRIRSLKQWTALFVLDPDEITAALRGDQR
jgi:hypothetical protein